MSPLAQRCMITVWRPFIRREFLGWGKIYEKLVSPPQSGPYWEDAGTRTIIGKRHNYIMELDLSKWSERIAYFLRRWYDLPTQLLLEITLKDGDTVVDIGANIGMFMLAARARIGDEGRVIAFEPNPLPRKKFERHVELNDLKNITLYPYALSDEAGEATLNFPKINTGEGSLSELAYKKEETESINVLVKIGDDILADTTPRLVKIDVEGAELSVLRGLEKTIDRTRPLIVAEYIVEHLSRFGTSHSDLEKFARERQYSIYRLSTTRRGLGRVLTLTPFATAIAQGVTTFDFLMIPDEDQTLNTLL
ncbi:MAG: FkbM family methyltransferase [Pseudomonadota bacterium]